MESRAGHLLLLGILAPVVLPAPAASGSTTIAWSSFAPNGSRAQIVSARPDGSQLHKLTSAKKDVFDFDPVISPDGSQRSASRAPI